MASTLFRNKLKRNVLIAGVLGSAAIIAAAVLFIRESAVFFQGIIGTVALSLIVVVLFIGALIGYLKARLELEARTAAEQERLQASRRFETAIENTPAVAVQAFDRTGAITLWNRAAEKIFGFSKGEAIGADLPELLLPEAVRPEFRKEMERVWATQKPFPPRERTLVTRSGEAASVLLTVFPIVAGDAVVEGFCMEVDISKNLRDRQELERSFERLQALSKMMVGREARVVELKAEVNELCDRLGEPRRYGI